MATQPRMGLGRLPRGATPPHTSSQACAHVRQQQLLLDDGRVPRKSADAGCPWVLRRASPTSSGPLATHRPPPGQSATDASPCQSPKANNQLTHKLLETHPNHCDGSDCCVQPRPSLPCAPVDSRGVSTRGARGQMSAQRASSQAEGSLWTGSAQSECHFPMCTKRV